MNYHEEVCDLFDVNKNNSDPYCLAHCISADFAMAGGIAVQFNTHFDMKLRLVKQYKDQIQAFDYTGGIVIPMAAYPYVCDNNFMVYNLITKKYVTERPTYEHLKNCLWRMKNLMLMGDYHKLAIPQIGCGIDGLKWNKVSGLIKELFYMTDIEVMVCMLK